MSEEAVGEEVVGFEDAGDIVKVDADGRRHGRGMLSLELVLLDTIGMDLRKNPYALNETIRILIRTTVPFLILVVVSLLTRRDDKAMLDRKACAAYPALMAYCEKSSTAADVGANTGLLHFTTEVLRI